MQAEKTEVDVDEGEQRGHGVADAAGDESGNTVDIIAVEVGRQLVHAIVEA